MLNLHSHSIEDKNTFPDIIKECQNRIASISLVHDKLLHSQDLSNLSFSSYLRDLVEGIKRSYVSNSDKIHFEIETDDSLLSIDHAVPCGLIINEIITNSIKYAFLNSNYTDDIIKIRAVKENDRFCLFVSDNGVGLPKSFDVDKTASLGIKLIRDLVKIQLSGSLDISRESGTHYSIFFSDSQYTRRI
jgi:two-component sensor histidine kinase